METSLPIATQTSAALMQENSTTSMESLVEFPCRRGFTQTSTTTLDHSGDFSANSASAPLKKKKLSACRNGKLPICQIDKSSSRQVTFCKRRNGLFKKAYELSVLCDAEVAAIVFSPSGKLSEFTSSSMSHIIKRCQRFQPQVPSNNLLLQYAKKWKCEALLLRSKLRCLEDIQRCIVGKKNIREFQSVESILEDSLDKLYKRKMQLLEVQTHEIKEKGEILCKETNVLKEKGETICKGTNVLKEKLIQIISMKECVNSASSG